MVRIYAFKIKNIKMEKHTQVQDRMQTAKYKQEQAKQKHQQYCMLSNCQTIMRHQSQGINLKNFKLYLP